MSWLDATADLLRVARDTLREQVIPTLKSDARYEAAMVGNAMAIAIREIEVGDRVRAEEQALLAEFLGTPTTTLPELRRLLCQELRDGAVLENRPGELRTLLRKLVYARLAISNPDYPRTQA